MRNAHLFLPYLCWVSFVVARRLEFESLLLELLCALSFLHCQCLCEECWLLKVVCSLFLLVQDLLIVVISMLTSNQSF